MTFNTFIPIIFGCTENGLSSIKHTQASDPNLVVFPAEIHFGLVQPNTSAVEQITLRNEGTQAIELTDISIEGVAFSITSSLPLGWLEVDEEVEVWVDYSPTFVEDSGWITIHSNDPYQPSIPVPLFGNGAYPHLIVDPPLLDFGWTELNTTVTEHLSLRNAGLADLTISNTLLMGGDFIQDTLPSIPITLTSEEEVILDFTFEPTEYGEQSGSFWIESNSTNPNTQVMLKGGASDIPIAICSAEPDTFRLMETTTWLGEDSIDPSGAVINEYNWVLIDAPSGSNVHMPTGNASSPNRPGFYPDMEGIYTAQLIVYNEYGQASEPCITSIEVTPPEDPCVDPVTAYDLHPEAQLMVMDHTLPLSVQFLNGTAGYTSELWLDQPFEVHLATGNQTPVGTTVGLQSVPAGSEMKFRIDVLNTGYTFYSGLAAENPDNYAHVAIAYLGECTWSIGFEDLYNGGDQDFDDIMLLISGNLEITF